MSPTSGKVLGRWAGTAAPMADQISPLHTSGPGGARAAGRIAGPGTAPGHATYADADILAMDSAGRLPCMVVVLREPPGRTDEPCPVCKTGRSWFDTGNTRS